MPFEYRIETGRQLAMKLESYELQKPIVLGIFGEGMPIAAEVARHLGARLDFILVREIHAPGIAGAGVGAVAEGGAVYIGPETARGGRLTIGDISALLEESVRELAVQVRRQRREHPFPDVGSRTVIVVDEAVTEVAVLLAAALAVRELGAEKVILAVPSIREDAAARLREEFDEVVAIECPAHDSEFLEPHREAIQHLKNARLEIVPGATHFFQEPGALRAVARLTNDWFEQHLCRPDPGLHARGNDLVLGPSTS